MARKKNFIGRLRMGNIQGAGTFALIMAIILAIVIFLYLYGTPFGFTATMGKSLITVLPYIFTTILSIFIMKQSSNSPIFIIGGFGGIGISIAFLMKALHDAGYLTDNMIGGGATVEIAMFWVAFVTIIIGGAVGMSISKRGK